MLSVEHLTPVAFLSFTGSVVGLTNFDDLEKRPDHVSFFKTKCDLIPSQIDQHFTRVPELSFVNNVSQTQVGFVPNLHHFVPSL